MSKSITFQLPESGSSTCAYYTAAIGLQLPSLHSIRDGPAFCVRASWFSSSGFASMAPGFLILKQRRRTKDRVEWERRKYAHVEQCSATSSPVGLIKLEPKPVWTL